MHSYNYIPHERFQRRRHEVSSNKGYTCHYFLSTADALNYMNYKNRNMR